MGAVVATPQPGQIVNGYTFAGGDPSDPTAWQPLTGDAFLKTLPSAQASQVHALAVGNMQFPSSFALTKPYWIKMLSNVSQYDPTFDTVNYNTRSSTRKDFTSGKSAQTINALNTALGHLDAVDKAGDALNNGELTPLNWAKNSLTPLVGYPEPNNFNTDAGLVAEELTKVYRGTGAEADVTRHLQDLSVNASPEQRRGALSQIASLLKSKLDALGQQYNQGMGTTKDPMTLLGSHSAPVFQRLLSYGPQGTPPQQQQPAANPAIDALLKKYGAQ